MSTLSCDHVACAPQRALDQPPAPCARSTSKGQSVVARNRLDPVFIAMTVDERHHHFPAAVALRLCKKCQRLALPRNTISTRSKSKKRYCTYAQFEPRPLHQPGPAGYHTKTALKRLHRERWRFRSHLRSRNTALSRAVWLNSHQSTRRQA
jgi:hypothetical protein